VILAVKLEKAKKARDAGVQHALATSR
jgi:hypothetical protein